MMWSLTTQPHRMAPYLLVLGVGTILVGVQIAPEVHKAWRAYQLNWAIVEGDDAAACAYLDAGGSFDQKGLYGYTPREMMEKEDRGYLMNSSLCFERNIRMPARQMLGIRGSIASSK